jgi:hypothetical protein
MNVLHWVPGSTIKVEQVIGDHDWADTTRVVTSRTVTQADVLGNGLGFSFESGDSLIFLFGDTIGASSQYVPRWAAVQNDFRWAAHDPMASSRTIGPENSLRLTFYRNSGDSTLVVLPVYPDSTPVDMGGDNIPNSGIDLGGQIDLVCSVGTTTTQVDVPQANDSSIIVRFDPVQKTFVAGRTMSRAGQKGHFVFTSPLELPTQFANSPTDSEVVIFGLGIHRASDIYLSMIKRKLFESGVKVNGSPATRYFTGLVGGVPVWGDTDSLAVPIVYDDPLSTLGVGVVQNPWPDDTPTIGNLSVVWAPELNLWLMTFDGGRQPGPAQKQTDGVYFTYAAAPWGPWMPPQQIFNAVRDSALGVWIHKYDHNTGIGHGPAGPTIGGQLANNPDTTSGANFAPQMIGRFRRLTGDTLAIDYTLSTWNPYTVVRMRSRFQLIPNATLGAAAPPPARALGLVVGPNPFGSRLLANVTVPVAGEVDLDVFDVGGRLVCRLHRGIMEAGRHTIAWDAATDAGGPAPAGLYFMRLRAAGAEVTRRLARFE